MEFDNIPEEPDNPYNIRHRCFFFAKEIIFFVRECKNEHVFTSVFEQLVRSGTSISANLIEGKAGSSKKDWKNFYVIALRSANETKYWLCLIRDTMRVDKTKAEELLKEADEISKIIATIVVNVQKGRHNF